MTVSAVSPWRTAFREARCFPSSLVGPVLLSALRRLASIYLSDVMGARQLNWVRFVIGTRCGGPRSADGLIDCLCTEGWRFDIRASRTCRRRGRVGLDPKFVGNALRLDAELRPPSHFIAGPMQLAMMGAAERHREFVADFEAKASRLREAQVMGIRRLAAANHTGLCGDKLAMAFVTPPPRFRRHRVIFKIQHGVGRRAGDATEPAGLTSAVGGGESPISGRRFVLPTSEQSRQSHPRSERA